MAQFLTLENLNYFKSKQDEKNLEKFASLENGVVKADQLPSYVDDVIEGYAVNNSGTVTIYKESGHTTAITGETGKIYVDLGSSPAKTYRWSGSAYVEIGSAASTADRATNDADGNPISTTYVKKTDKATSSDYGIVKIGTNIGVSDGAINVATGTTSALGVLKVGSNIAVTNGEISIGSAQVIAALGFTPVDSTNFETASDSDIDALFS